MIVALLVKASVTTVLNDVAGLTKSTVAKTSSDSQVVVVLVTITEYNPTSSAVYVGAFAPAINHQLKYKSKLYPVADKPVFKV